MNPQFVIRVSAVVTFALCVVTFANSADVEAAAKDRAAHYAQADWPSIAYITLFPSAGDAAKDLDKAIKLMICSDSIQPVVERSMPVKIATGLYRIDLRDLLWRYEDWVTVAYHRNPYAIGDALPLVVRADWLLVELSDRQESDTYDRLIFGGDKLPKTEKDVLKFFKVENDAQLTFGLIEGQSEVSKQGTRRIESLPLARGYAWTTHDVLKLDGGRDPVEHPEGGSPFDGEEGIIGMPKMSSTTGKRGVLQWYWLNNGKTELVNRAPVDLVEDATHFRGYREIRRPGSCVQCHAEGLNPFKRNEFRELAKSGVKVFASSKQRDELEAFHLSDLKTEISRANDDFQTIVELVCGCKSIEAVKAFHESITRYDAPLNLQATADELGVDVAVWTRVLATTTDLPARFASLPYGGHIPRAAWEENFSKAFAATHGGQPIKREPNVEQPAQQQKAEPQPVKKTVIEKPVEKQPEKPKPRPVQRYPQFDGAGRYLPPINNGER